LCYNTFIMEIKQAEANMENVYLTALQMVKGIGNSRMRSLISYFGGARQAWEADRCDLMLCGYLAEDVVNRLMEQRKNLNIQALAETCQAKGIRICSIYDADYPQLLKTVYNPPALFYYRGRLPVNENLIAVIGARKATTYGKNAAQMLAGELVAAGVGVVSGAARGIDTAAHVGALKQGSTFAVLGCGVDVVYPQENKKLLEQIAENGAIISEYAPGTVPHPAYFPARNRIISGLARGVVVVEAGEKSGALITADYALEEGRDVFAVPGSIYSPFSKGTHKLLKQGAKLVTSVSDILEEYQISMVLPEEKGLELNPDEKKIYEQLMPDNPVSIEEIVMKSQLSSAFVTYILLQLQLRGLALEHNDRRYTSIAQEGIR
jgi:DNA processing protein